jgi:hypothetical protein
MPVNHVDEGLAVYLGTVGGRPRMIMCRATSTPVALYLIMCR